MGDNISTTTCFSSFSSFLLLLRRSRALPVLCWYPLALLLPCSLALLRQREAKQLPFSSIFVVTARYKITNNMPTVISEEKLDEALLEVHQEEENLAELSAFASLEIFDKEQEKSGEKDLKDATFVNLEHALHHSLPFKGDEKGYLTTVKRTLVRNELYMRRVRCECPDCPFRCSLTPKDPSDRSKNAAQVIHKPKGGIQPILSHSIEAHEKAEKLRIFQRLKRVNRPEKNILVNRIIKGLGYDITSSISSIQAWVSTGSYFLENYPKFQPGEEMAGNWPHEFDLNYQRTYRAEKM